MKALYEVAGRNQKGVQKRSLELRDAKEDRMDREQRGDFLYCLNGDANVKV